MAEKKATGKSKKTKSGAKSRAKAKKAAPKKSTAKKAAPKKRKASSKPTSGLDKSVAQFRESLEQSVTLSRERIQDVVDDAVRRGRITRGDAEKMLSDLVKRGRKHTDALLKELERLVKQARREVGGRANAHRRQATKAAQRARKKLS
jgi:polyhydroxyalkanoate synthesis regulator phasin